MVNADTINAMELRWEKKYEEQEAAIEAKLAKYLEEKINTF
jgi:hypothetical protein